jgi:dTDP-4-dehydrorhamnose 3,5-epimerase
MTRPIFSSTCPTASRTACVLSEVADVVYKCSAYYDPASESGFRYDDPAVGIDWPGGLELKPSLRDREAPPLRELEGRLPFTYSA